MSGCGLIGGGRERHGQKAGQTASGMDERDERK